MKEDTNKFTETEKLLTSGKNAERLLKSVEEVRSGKLMTKQIGFGESIDEYDGL